MGGIVLHVISFIWLTVLASFVIRFESTINIFHRLDSVEQGFGYRRLPGGVYTDSFCYFQDLIEYERWEEMGVSCNGGS